MRWVMSFIFTTTVVGRTWPDMPSTCSSYNTTHGASLWSSGAALLDMLRKSRTSSRRSRKAQEVGVVRQQIRDLESRLRDKEEALLSSLHRSSERDQELLRHCVLLRTAEETAKVKVREFEEF
jgi:hypothetical protein